MARKLFKLGDNLQHVAAQGHSPRKLVVVETGIMKEKDQLQKNIYIVVGERRDSYAANDNPHFRSVLDENELKVWEDPMDKIKSTIDKGFKSKVATAKKRAAKKLPPPKSSSRK